MELIVDLHTHSHYSYATSKNSTLEELYRWGKIKGITIIGTGDFTHPLWFKELLEKLEPAEKGLFVLKDAIAKKLDETLPDSIKHNQIRFILTVEVSTIFSRYGKMRKLHNLITAPSLSAALALNKQLQPFGNLTIDGRPTLVLDCQELLALTRRVNSGMFFIPAHIWTPWFGMFGSKSGFTSIEEAFADLSPFITTIETGLSSDPFMNWRVTELQKRSLISSSDAHSPSKLGREAAVLHAQLEYQDIIEGMKTNDERLNGTIEFFPQEGKYFYDGHRSCGIVFSPKQTQHHHGVCPVCHRKLTIGVEHRVEELSSFPPDYQPKKHKKVEYSIPLVEQLAAIKKKGSATKTVSIEYQKTIAALGDEFAILRKIPIPHIALINKELANSIDKMRLGHVHIEPGYDGVYGKVSVHQEV